MAEKDDKAFPVISVPSGMDAASANTGIANPLLAKPEDQMSHPTSTPQMGLKIEGLTQPASGVISTQGITFTVIPSPQPQQGQRFMIPKVSPAQPQLTGINPLTLKTIGSTSGAPAGLSTVGNLTMKPLGANQPNVGANPLAGNMNVKPVGASPGTPPVITGGGLPTGQTSFMAGKTSIGPTSGAAVGVTTIPNLQLAAATLQQPAAAGLQQSSNGSVQQLQIPANLQAQAAQLGGQFILIKTEPQGQPALGMLQKGCITTQQLQGAQIIGQAPIRLEPKLSAAAGKVPVKGKQGTTGDFTPLQAQQHAAHRMFSKDKMLTKKNKSISQIQIQPAAMIRHPLPSPTATMQQIQARFQSFQAPGSPQPQPAKGMSQTQATQSTIPSPSVSPSTSQARPIQLPKVVYKQMPPVAGGAKSPLVTTPVVTSQTLQSFPIPTTPTSNVVTTITGSAGTTFAQPIILNQGGIQQRFILQTAPNQPGAIRMSTAQPGKPPPLVKLVPAAKSIVPPVSLTSATVAQQLAQSRPRLTGPLAQQLRPVTTVTTAQPPSPVVSQISPQGLSITQQQLLQAGLRQPLPPGTQLHITSTSKGLQLQPIQTQTISSVSTPTLVSPRMTVAQNLQLQAQAKLVPRLPTTTAQQGTFASLQGKITTLGQLGALSNAHLIAGSSIQVQGSIPQTSMMSTGQVTSPAVTLPLQATIIPTSVMSSQANALTGQIVVQQPLQQTLGTTLGQGKGTLIGNSSSSSTGGVGVNQQQALQGRIVYQQADQGQGSGTPSTLPANIAIQPMPNTGSPQRSAQGPNIQGSPLTSGTSQAQVSPGQSLQTVVQPQLIQTCGAQATIGLIQVSISQVSSQQPGTVDTVSTVSAPMVRATLQGPTQASQAGVTQPTQVSPARQMIQVTGVPGQQQFIQVVGTPMVSPQLQSSLNVPVPQKIIPAEGRTAFPKLDDIEIEETDPVSTIDLAIRYKMLYPQAPIPRRKRRHSETAEKEAAQSEAAAEGKTGETSGEQKKGAEEKGETSKEGGKEGTDKIKEEKKEESENDGKKKTEEVKEEDKPGSSQVKQNGEVKQEKPPVAVKTESTSKEATTTREGESPKLVINETESTSQEPTTTRARPEEESVEFTWDEYLELTGACPVPHDAFRHVEAGIKSIIKVGMKVEAPNKPSLFNPTSKTYWVATVVATSGTLLLLRYEGYGENRSADFWCELTKADLHPIGWCARSGRILQPPDSLMGNNINWQEFLVATLTGSKTIPEPYLMGKTKPISVDRIKRGMRIELTDAEDPQYVWIAIIKENHGGRLRLRYAGIDDEKEDMWLHYLSWRVHPVGWAKAHDAVVGPPRSLRQRNPSASEAHWNTAHQYALAAAYKDPIPKDIFKDQPKLRSHQFRVGMKLEAINPRSPSQITPATVSKVFKDKYFTVTIDDCTSEKSGSISFVCHADCGGIFPVKWCKRHGFSITPPKGYEGVKFDWNSYLRQHGIKGAPSDCFRSTKDSEHHPLQPGFKLEAVNPYHPAQISVSTITKVAGRHVWLHFDGSKLPNHIVDTKGFDIFPVGWCDTNGYPLRAPKKLLAKRRKIAIVWPEKHHHNRLMPSSMSPGRDLYQKVRGGKPEEAAGEGWIGKLYFNHKCFSGPFLNKGRIAELPKAVGPGMVTLVIREVISLLVNAGYKPPRVLRELQVENEETAGMNGYLQIMKAKYKGKSFRALVEICKTTAEVNEYLRNMCIKLECCPNLVSQKFVEDECPETCAMLTKTKYNYTYGKKKPPKIGRPPGPSTSPVDKKGRKRKKRRPFVHRKKHNLLPGSGENGEGEAAEENGEAEPMEEGGEGAAGLSVVKHEKPAVTRARALVESAKRSKKIHHTTPKLILPARERGTKMKAFAAKLTSSRAQRKAEKMEEEQAKKESLLTAKAEKEKEREKKQKKKSQEIDRLHLKSNPLKWTVEEVVQFILKTDCATLSNIFSEQEIDGQALLLLTLPTVQECMDLKLGPAIKLCHHIERVKIAFYEQFAQ